MSTRTRQSQRIQEDLYDDFEDGLDLDMLSDEELEEILFEEDEAKRRSPFNLPTMAGLSMIVVGLAYLLERLGVLSGFNLGAMVSWLPWLAGVLIILAAGGAGAFAIGWLALRQIDGYTGDVLGATQQAAEAAVLVFASAVIMGSPV